MFCRLTLPTLLIAIVLGSSEPATAQPKQTPLSGKLEEFVIYAPQPEYPYEARAKWLEGRAIVLLNVDPRTGYVLSASLQQSTGHKILDDSALDAFRQWRFKPGTVAKAKVPATFSLRGAQPNGLVLVDVDSKTGRVTSARTLQSTGSQALDEAALEKFRNWRFKPGTAPKVRIPITFDLARTR